MIIQSLPRTDVITVDRVGRGDVIHAIQGSNDLWVLLTAPLTVIIVNPALSRNTAGLLVRHGDARQELLEIGYAARVLVRRRRDHG